MYNTNIELLKEYYEVVCENAQAFKKHIMEIIGQVIHIKNIFQIKEYFEKVKLRLTGHRDIQI